MELGYYVCIHNLSRDGYIFGSLQIGQTYKLRKGRDSLVLSDVNDQRITRFNFEGIGTFLDFNDNFIKIELYNTKIGKLLWN